MGGAFRSRHDEGRRIVDAGDQVVVIAAWRGRDKASGVDAEWRYGAVWTLRDSKVVSVVSYLDPAQALEAVGLREQAQLSGLRILIRAE